jgi:hypothetical protein
MSSFDKAVLAFAGIHSDIQEILGKPMAIDRVIDDIHHGRTVVLEQGMKFEAIYPPITVTISDLKELADIACDLDGPSDCAGANRAVCVELHAWVARVAGDRAGEIYAVDE